MPEGKAAAVRCIQLTDDLRCNLFGQSTRPAVCVSLKPSVEMCGESNAQAMAWLAALESRTRP
jgi:hypothetical protein